MKTALFSIVFAFCTSAFALSVGDQAPDLDMIHLAPGVGTESTQALLGGKPTVMEFFLIECPACIENHPKFVTLSQELGNKATFKLIGVDRNEAALREYAAKNTANAFVVLDHKRAASKAYGAKAVPTTLVVGADGKILFQLVDVWSEGDIATIKALLQ